MKEVFAIFFFLFILVFLLLFSWAVYLNHLWNKNRLEEEFFQKTLDEVGKGKTLTTLREEVRKVRENSSNRS